MQNVARDEPELDPAPLRELRERIADLVGVPASRSDLRVPSGELKQFYANWPDINRALLLAEHAAALAKEAYERGLDDSAVQRLEELWEVVDQQDNTSKRNALFDAVEAMRPEYEMVLTHAAAARKLADPKKPLSRRDVALLKRRPDGMAWVSRAGSDAARRPQSSQNDREFAERRDLCVDAVLRAYHVRWPRVAAKLAKHYALLAELLDAWGERRAKRGQWAIAADLLSKVGLGAAPGTLKTERSAWGAKVRTGS